MFKLQLGDHVKDRITGFSGIIVSQCMWYNGCVRYGVQSKKLDKDGDTLTETHFDEMQLVKQKTGHIHPPTTKKGSTGGPRKAPQKRSDARR